MFNFKPEEHQEIMLDLHDKITSKEWWIFNFIGEDAVWFRDKFAEPFVNMIGLEDCVGTNIKVVREEGQPFILAVMMVRKSCVYREVFPLVLALRFPGMAFNFGEILEANPEQDLFVFTTSNGYEKDNIEILKVWQKCVDVDPNNLPSFPFHLSLIK